MNEVFSKDLGIVTAYGYALSKGYTGTEEQFATLMASYATIGQQAVDAALAAEGYAVGTHNGTPVPSTDPAYENNSKYYAEQIEAESESFARIDGSYESMTVGNAEQLISSQGVTEQTPYNFRTSGGSADIGNRKTMQIVGGSLSWNQMLPALASGNNWDTQNNATVTFADGVATLTATEQYGRLRHRIDYIAGHKLFITADIKLNSVTDANLITLGIYGFNTGIQCTQTTDWQRLTGIMTNATASSNNRVIITDGRTSNFDSILIKNVMFIDLTLLFGTAIADYIYSLETANTGDGVAYFRKLFPKPYYAYNAGELESVNVSAAEMVGFNQISGYKQGAYNSAGVFVADSTNVASELIRVVPGLLYVRYASKIPSVYRGDSDIRCYDVSGNFIGNNLYTEASGTYQMATHFFKPNDNVAYIAFTFRPQSGTLSIDTVKNDCCLHLVWSGTRNDEYEPYEKRTYPLDSSLTLRGIPKLNASNELYYDGDTYEADGTVTRKYGIVDLGTLTWQKGGTGTGQYPFFYSNNLPATGVQGATCICAKYVAASVGSTESTDKVCYMDNNGAQLRIRDTAYSGGTTTAFKTAMSGVYLVYELATPTTESADAFQSPMVVNDWGTEALVDYAEAQGIRDVAIPCGNVSFYQANLVEKLNHLPSLASGGDGNYIISQSGTQMTLVPLTTPTEIPAAPTTDGTYTLSVTVADGQATYSWT